MILDNIRQLTTRKSKDGLTYLVGDVKRGVAFKGNIEELGIFSEVSDRVTVSIWLYEDGRVDISRWVRGDSYGIHGLTATYNGDEVDRDIILKNATVYSK